MEFNEEIFKREAEKIISMCRPGDWEHAKRVVFWVKKIGEHRKDSPLLIISAYIHDIGWKGLVSEKEMSFDKLLLLEKEANHNSKVFVKEFLSNLNFCEEDIKIVYRLIRAADKHTSNAEDEEIIVDADSLSKLDINHLKEKFKRKDWKRLFKLWEDEFPKRIKTKIGKQIYPPLFESLKDKIKEN